ncbi:sensor histidine kinase [Flavitalea sp.]|nr:PAS domain-containing protein [Flavitalea sp.]
MNSKFRTSLSLKLDMPFKENFVQALFDFVFNMIQILKPVRSEIGLITNFRIMIISNDLKEFPEKPEFENKLYLEEFPESISSGLFDKLVNVVERKEALDGIFHFHECEISKWLHFKAKKLEDGMIIFREDVTERVQSEKQAEQQTHFAEHIGSMTPDIIQVVDIEKQEVIYSNRIIYEDLGYTSFEIRDLTLNRTLFLHHPDDRQKVLEFRNSFETASENEVKEYEGRILSKDGNWIWYTSLGRVFEQNEQGRPTQYIKVSRNITRYKETERQLEQSKIFLEDIMNTVPAIITVYSIGENKIIYANENRLMDLGDTSGQIFQLSNDQWIALLIHPDDQVAVQQFMSERNKLHDGEILEIEHRLKMRKGDWQWYKTSSKVFARDTSGVATQIISFITNINTQKQSEENIRRLSQMLVIKNLEFESCNSELNLFANVAGHEYKETFRHLYTLLENTITRDGKYLSNGSKADLRRIQSSFQKLKLLTEDIIFYSTIHSNTVEIQVDLNDTIKTLENELKDQIAETGTTINYDNLPNVIGQPVLIALLLRHLIVNAIKFRSPDRKPNILIKYYCLDGINLHSNDVMGNIKFTVVSIIDNGIGFDNQYAKDIFSLFFRLHDKGKYKGSGMGLPVCKKIMVIHQGFITAESSNFHGATFNCFFPSETIKNIS